MLPLPATSPVAEALAPPAGPEVSGPGEVAAASGSALTTVEASAPVVQVSPPAEPTQEAEAAASAAQGPAEAVQAVALAGTGASPPEAAVAPAPAAQEEVGPVGPPPPRACFTLTGFRPGGCGPGSPWLAGVAQRVAAPPSSPRLTDGLRGPGRRTGSARGEPAGHGHSGRGGPGRAGTAPPWTVGNPVGAHAQRIACGTGDAGVGGGHSRPGRPGGCTGRRGVLAPKFLGGGGGGFGPPAG